MLRVDGLWNNLTSFANLHSAAYQVLRGKRDQQRACDFFRYLEDHLLCLQEELRAQT